MNYKFYRIIILIFLIPVTCLSISTNTNLQTKYSIKQNQDIAQQVRRAFNEVRKNLVETPNLDNLKTFGEEVIPYLETYLNDPNTNVRTEAVNLALEIGGKKSLNLIASALQSSRPSLQLKSSELFYEYYSKCRQLIRNKETLTKTQSLQCSSLTASEISLNPQIEKGLKRIIKSGKGEIYPIFLLSNFSDKDSREILESLASLTDCKSNAVLTFNKIKHSLASKIVLANKDNYQNNCLLEIAKKENIETLKFLLININEIESSSLLMFLIKTLDNTIVIEPRKTSKEFVKTHNLPKGSFIDFHPPRRLCDLAVTAFTERFNLKVDIKSNSTNFFKHQIDAVRELTKQALTDK